MAQEVSFSHLSTVSIQKAHAHTLRRAASKAFSGSNLKANSEEMMHTLQAQVLKIFH
jgi:hypothetical protein